MSMTEVRTGTPVDEPVVETPKKIQKLRGVEAWEIGQEMPEGAVYVFATGMWRHVSEAMFWQVGNVLVNAEGEAEPTRYTIIPRPEWDRDYEFVPS